MLKETLNWQLNPTYTSEETHKDKPVVHFVSFVLLSLRSEVTVI